MCRQHEIEAEIRRLAEPILARHGVELVSLGLRGARGRQVLRVDIDRAGAGGVDLEDCQRVSRELGDALDRVDVLTSAYVLEVSSPGIDRPIRSADDIRRNTGRRVLVTATDSGGAERQYRGTLLGCDDGALRLEGDDHEEIRIPLDGVVGARQDIAL